MPDPWFSGGRWVKRYSKLLTVLVVLSVLSSLVPAVSQGPIFALESTSFRSSTGGSVYPGSSGARLVVGARYLGTGVAYSVHGCLELPPGFSTQYRCAGARDLSGSYATSVNYGEVVYFTYIVDVDKSVFPSVYTLKLSISARIGGSLTSEVLEVKVEVSPYPELRLEVLDAYWSPEAYPGTVGASLYLVFRSSNTRIDSASITVELPEGFYPRTTRRALGSVGSYSTFTVVASGISISKSISPGLYSVLVKVDAIAVTDDGVHYSASVAVQASVPIGSPPQLLLRVVSSGWVGPRVPYSSKGSDYRVVLRLDDAATISSLVAVMKLPECARSFNESSSVVVYMNRPVSYGEVFELLFSGITVACQSTTAAELILEVLATKDGSEFWVTQAYTVPLVIQNPAVDVRVVSSYWSPGPAYPGSSKLSLVLVVENYDYVSLYGGVMSLSSNIVEPRESTVSNFAVNSLSRSTVVFSGLSIPRSVVPGVFELRVVLDCLASSDGSVYAITTEFRVLIRVSEPPSPQLEVLSYGWVDGRAFGHSVGNTLRIDLRNSDPSVTVRSLRASLEIPKCFSISELRKTFASSTVVTYGSTIVLDFGGIDILCDGGVYRASLVVEVMGDVAGSSFWQSIVYDLAIAVEDPVLNIDVVDAGWASGIAYRNSSRLSPYVVLVSYTRDSLANTIVHVRPINAKLSDGSSEAVVALRDPVPYGSSFTVRLPTLEVDAEEDSVEVELFVVALVRYGQTAYNASKRLKIGLPLVFERNLVVTWSHVEYGGSPSPLLPTARGVRVYALLTNLRSEPVSVSGISIDSPQGLKVMGVEGDCSRATLTSGGTCSLSIVLDVQDNIKPSTYTLRIRVDYVKSVSGASLYGTEVLAIPVAVDSLEDYIPEVRVLEVFWGAQQPMTAFPNSKQVPVTLVVQNVGRYDAMGVTTKVDSSKLVPVVNSAECSGRLPAGTTCTTVLYFDIPASTEGYVRLNTSLEYYVTVFGTYARVLKSYTNWLYVEPLGHYGGGLKPVSWSWLNNYNVFPNTENATFVVTVANRLPYTVSGVVAELYLPTGFRGSRGNVSTAYVDGPVRSYSSVALGFRVSVGGVSPGKYRAVVRLDYVALSGGPGVRIVEEYEVEIPVVDDREAVEVVSSGWLEGSAEPGTYGALLHLVVRNNLVDGMTGVFLQLNLPEGILSSLDNSSTIRVPPVSQQVLQSLLGAGRPQQVAFAQLLRQVSTTTTTHGRGDLIDFVVPLNVLVNATGRYIASATLHYIDSWGTPRQCRFSVPLAVLGSVRYIDVYIDGGTLRVASRFTKAVLKLRNVGEGPAYNVYLAVFPYAQLPAIIASPSVNYIDRIEPGREVEVVLNLAYNPMGVYVSGAQTVVSYGTVPLVVGVIYRDVGGRVKTFNTTIAVVVEPFVDLVLREAKAVMAAGTLRVSGTLVNYGSATAYRASARVCVGIVTCSESFIGDVEPGSQRAFSVSVAIQGLAARANLTIFYYNVYNELQQIQYSVPTTVATPATPTTTPAEGFFATERWVVVIAVAGFLAVVAYTIYRVVSSYYGKLKTSSEVSPP